MTTSSRYQGGYKKEGTYGTDPTVDAFFRVIKDEIVPQYAKLQSNSLRPGFVRSQTQFVNWLQGAQGPLSFEVSGKQFAKLFWQCLGAVSSTGPDVPVTGYYQHTYSMHALNDRSFTWQGNRPKFPTDADLAYTFTGGKVTKWKLSNSVEGLLILDLDCDFQSWTNGTALASASYPTVSDPLFSFLGASVTMSGTSVPVYDFSIEVDNSLKVDRRYLDNSQGLKKEQVGSGFRMGTWSATVDNDNSTQLDRIAKASAAAGNVASIVATWAVAGATEAVQVTLAAPSFDEGYPKVSGPDALNQPLKGQIFDDGTNSPVSIVYTTLLSASS